MRVLIFGNHEGGKVFYNELIEWLTRSGVEVDLLDWGNYQIHHDNFSSVTDIKPSSPLLLALTKVKYIRKFAKVQLIKRTLRQISSPYDVINVHFGNAANNPYINLFREKGKKLVVTIWGSDYDRVPDETRQAARKLYDEADVINFGNPDMRDDFTSYFNSYANKTAIAGFGDDKLTKIANFSTTESRETSKQEVGIPKDALVITCGYKAFHILQHHKILDALETIRETIPDNHVLVFPLTYHRDEKYVSDLKDRLSKSGFNHVIYEDFLTDDNLTRLRVASDIYITIPVTDGASFSLLEYMTAGNVVVAGDWLPYKFHKELGLKFHSTSLDKLAETIESVVSNFPSYRSEVQGNASIILDTFGWPKKVKEWLALYEKAS